MMAEALGRWLREEMELPPSAAPSPAALRRLCSGPTAPVWDYVTRHVRNQRNVKKIRGNLRWYGHLQELEAAAGPPSQQGAQRASAARLRKELQGLGDAIADAQETAQRLEASLEEGQSRRWAELQRGAELRLLGAGLSPAGLRAGHQGALKAFPPRPGQSQAELSAILASGVEPEVLVSIKALCRAREAELQRPRPHRAANHSEKAQEEPDWLEQAEAVLIGHSPGAVLWALEALANQSTRALLAGPAPSAEAPPTLRSLLQERWGAVGGVWGALPPLLSHLAHLRGRLGTHLERGRGTDGAARLFLLRAGLAAFRGSLRRALRRLRHQNRPNSPQKSPRAPREPQRPAPKPQNPQNLAPKSPDLAPKSSDLAPKLALKPENSVSKPQNSAPKSSDLAPKSALKPQNLAPKPQNSASKPQNPQNSPPKSPDLTPKSALKPENSASKPQNPQNSPPKSPDLAPKSALKTQNSAPNPQNSAPKSPDLAPKSALNPENSAPKSPNSAPKSPNFAPKSPNFAPKSPNFAPKSPNSAPKSPNSAPKSPNSAPKSPNLAPKSPNLAPKSPNFAPKSPNLAPKSRSWAPNPADFAPNSALERLRRRLRRGRGRAVQLQQRLRFLSAASRGRRAALRPLQEQVVGVARAGPGSASPLLEGAWLRHRQLALGALEEPRPPAQATPPLQGLAREMGVAQGALLSRAAILRQELRQGALRLRQGAGPALGAGPEPAAPPLHEGVAELLPQLRLVSDGCRQRIRDWPRLRELVSEWWAQPAQWALATPSGHAPFAHWLQRWRAAAHTLQATPTPEEAPPTAGQGEERGEEAPPL